MSTETQPSDLVVLPDGSLRCGQHVIAPWPSLQISPARGFHRFDSLLSARAEKFTRTIPQPLLQTVRSFPECHWQLLELCAGHPARGMELVTANPALAMLTIEHCSNSAADRRRRDLSRLVNRPWRGILADLGLPTRPRTIRILGKLPVAHCTVATVTRLRRVLRTSNHHWVHVLPHLPFLTRDTVGLMAQDAEVITPTLIRATLESTPDVETVSWLCNSIQSLRADLGHTSPWPYRGLDLEQLKLVEGRLTNLNVPDYFALFPPPPLPGIPGVIIPVRDFVDLAKEGAGQANCAVLYLSSILASEAYVYRLLRPERATLVIERSGLAAPWTLTDLRCYDNTAVADTTLACVKRWIEEAPRVKVPKE